MITFLCCVQLLAASVLPLQDPLILDESASTKAESENICIQHHGNDNDTMRATAFVNPGALGLDARSAQWSGYLDTGDNKQLFFWLFESRRDPANDPIILWLNGGPGVSSLYGALTQWGPKILTESKDFKDNPAFLNEHYTLLFLDQPTGTGFSFSTNRAGDPDNSDGAAADVLRFLDTFFRTDFNGRRYNTQDFHMAGESYAGHYIPVIAREIVNRPPPVAPERPIALRSIFIGNGWYDGLVQQRSIYQMICDGALTSNRDWLLSPPECAEWQQKLVTCEAAMAECRRDRSTCSYLGGQCSATNAGTYQQLRNRDIYDLTVKLKFGEARNNVEDGKKILQEYLSITKRVLGVDPAREWVLDNKQIQVNFRTSGDETRDVTPDIARVLTTANPAYQNVRVLLFAVSSLLLLSFCSPESSNPLAATPAATHPTKTTNTGRHRPSRPLHRHQSRSQQHRVAQSGPFSGCCTCRVGIQPQGSGPVY